MFRGQDTISPAPGTAVATAVTHNTRVTRRRSDGLSSLPSSVSDPQSRICSSTPLVRVQVRGKFLFKGEHKLLIRGVTYGTFAPNSEGDLFPAPQVVEADFAAMVANGFNAVRTYTLPPRWLLDLAGRFGLYVMVGMWWEQNTSFLEDMRTGRRIVDTIRAGVDACAGHPAVLCYSLGNEIPASIVRWHGKRAMERFLERLYHVVKATDPDGLFTYVNYPSTEYLQLPFLDLACFNVYLESQERFDAYLARLQNVVGDTPLLLGELGLDSRQHGEAKQVSVLDWQIRAAFGQGCAGAFAFAWTDEWFCGGRDIVDWDFGLTRRDRSAKPVLRVVREAFSEVPFAVIRQWPRVSVIVCTYNGARTLGECLSAVFRLSYPNFETIVVNDGSVDDTAQIAAGFAVRFITTENRGLSHARNVGLAAATGDIVAYLDDDAYPDPDWLKYIATALLTTNHAGVGGPNIPPPSDGPVAECVANAPGGPVHVLLSDRVAEHIPGCNMAFWKHCLEAVGGFDAQFRVAGDDVDLCWRLQEMGWDLGFVPSAVVWHHRRNSVLAYWRQQEGYGKAEALLERKWPEKYNTVGHIKWSGRLYGRGLPRLFGGTSRIYYGVWGRAPFQALDEPCPGLWNTLPAMPEWYLLMGALGLLSVSGLLWTKLWLALPIAVAAVAVTVCQAVRGAAKAVFPTRTRSRWQGVQRRSLTTLLFLLQPIARLRGRIRNGLPAWRLRATHDLALPHSRRLTYWTEQWRAPEETLQGLERALRGLGLFIQRGGPFQRWDLEVRGGMIGRARLLMTVEEHGNGKQRYRFRLWPQLRWEGVAAGLLGGALTLAAASEQAGGLAIAFALLTILLSLRWLQESAAALASLEHLLRADGIRKP